MFPAVLALTLVSRWNANQERIAATSPELFNAFVGDLGTWLTTVFKTNGTPCEFSELWENAPLIHLKSPYKSALSASGLGKSEDEYIQKLKPVAALLLQRQNPSVTFTWTVDESFGVESLQNTGSTGERSVTFILSNNQATIAPIRDRDDTFVSNQNKQLSFTQSPIKQNNNTSASTTNDPSHGFMMIKRLNNNKFKKMIAAHSDSFNLLFNPITRKFMYKSKNEFAHLNIVYPERGEPSKALTTPGCIFCLMNYFESPFGREKIIKKAKLSDDDKAALESETKIAAFDHFAQNCTNCERSGSKPQNLVHKSRTPRSQIL